MGHWRTLVLILGAAVALSAPAHAAGEKKKAKKAASAAPLVVAAPSEPAAVSAPPATSAEKASAANPAGGAPASAPLADKRHKVAMLGLTAGSGFDAKTLGTIEELLLGALEATGKFAVTGRSDLGALVGLDQQKQILGCDDDAACVTELAGALGVEFISSGDVGKLGTVTILTLKLVDVKAAKVVARVRRTVQNEGDLATAIDGAAVELAAVVDRGASPAVGQPMAPPIGSSSGGLGAGFWTSTATAVLAGAVGGYFAQSAWTSAGVMENATSVVDYSRASADAASASTRANVSFAVVGAGCLTAAGFWLFGGSDGSSLPAAHASVSASHNGIVVAANF